MQCTKSIRKGRLGERTQIVPKPICVTIAEKRFDSSMGLFPDGNGAGQCPSSLCRERHPSPATIRWVCCHPDQASSPQGLEGGRQRSPIHCQQQRHCRHPWRFRPVQRHQQRELPVGQADRAQRLVEAPGQRPCRSLYVQAETGIADQMCCLKGRLRSGGHKQIIWISTYLAKRRCPMIG